MQLEKTLHNLRLTKDSFFNLEKGSEVWFEILKQNLCVLRNGFDKKHYLKDYFYQRAILGNYFNLKNYDGHNFSIVINKNKFVYNCFLVNGKNKKDI